MIHAFALKPLFRSAVLSFCLIGAAQAADQGTAAEAEAMVKKAVGYIAANGREKAAAEFTSGASFKDRDLYVSWFQLDGQVIAHGANPKLVGKNLMAMKDPNGRPLIQMITDVARQKGKGWTDTYLWRNPTTDKMQEKTIYVERVEDTWVGVGIYKN
jgi:cytochrome c